MKRISHKYIIFWLLLDNYKKGNDWRSAGHFCTKDVDMRHLGYHWLSYKGATRISDTVFQDLDIVERKEAKSRSGAMYFVYRLKEHFKIGEVPENYRKYLYKYQKLA